MKVEVQITSLEEEKIVIYCKEITKEINAIRQILEIRDQTLLGYQDDKNILIMPEEILYFEAVDKKIFGKQTEQTCAPCKYQYSIRS